MTAYRISVSNGQNVANLTLEDGGLFGFPTWSCVEGEMVWGVPKSGSCLSPNLTSGQIELSLGVAILNWAPNLGASGEGFRLNDNGGSFPTGDFNWTVEALD